MARRLEAPDQKAKELARKLESHSFTSEEGQEYTASTFGGIGDYKRNKRTKLQNRDAHIRTEHASSYPPLFRGLAIWINGETSPTPYELGRLIVKHSGVRFQYLDGKTHVTHIIASNLTLKKKVEFARYKVVRPEWVTESIRAGVLLPWSDFRLIDEIPAQSKISFMTPTSSVGVGPESNDNVERPLKGVPAGISKIDHRISAPRSSFINQATEQQVGLLRAANVDRPSQMSRRDIKQAVPGLLPIKRAMGQYQPRASPPHENTTVPISGKPNLDEEDELSSKNLPANNISFSSFPSYQPRRSFDEKEKGEEESEGLEPVILVRMPSKRPANPKPDASEHEPVLPKQKIFTFSSPPPPNTFPPPAPPPKPTWARKPQLPSKSLRPEKLSKPKRSSRPKPVAIISGQEAYEVEAFIGERLDQNSKGKRVQTEYLVSWKGYPLDEATWEPGNRLKKDLKDGEFDSLLSQWRKLLDEGSASDSGGGSGKVQVSISVEVPIKVRNFDHRSSRPSGKLVAESIVEDSPLRLAVVEQQTQEQTIGDPRTMSLGRELAYGIIPSEWGKKEKPVLSIGASAIQPVTDTREIRDSLSPDDIMDEDEDFGWGVEDQQVMDNEGAHLFNKITTGSPEIAMQKVAVAVEPENSQMRIISQSFESVYGTPVDFTEDFVEETLGGDLDIPDAPKLIQDTVFQTDIMDSPPENEKSDIALDLNRLKDIKPHTMEYFTPMEIFEEHEALSNTQQIPEVMGSPERPQKLPVKNTMLHRQEMTAEQKMAAYLSNPSIRDQTCLNPGFLQKYHEESRLHQLSTWKARLRAELQALADAKSSSESTNHTKSRPRRYILHVDFDCFFAAVSTRGRPDLVGKPVAVTHGNTESSATSEIASCNYAAREFGVKNGMWMEKAKELCPGIICLPYEFQKYEEASKVLYEVILSKNAEKVQAVSVDEVLIDASNLCYDMGLESEAEEENMAMAIANEIRNACRERTGGLEVSVGIGGNVMLAKLATKKAKPAGQYLIKSTEVTQFMDEVFVRELPGIGSSIAAKVEEKLGVNTVGEIRGHSKERLKNMLGEKTGEKLWRYCRGLDDTVVGQTVVRKSVSVDVNWGIRFENQEQAEKFVADIAEEVEKKMRQEVVKGKHLTLKVNKRAQNAPFITPKHLGCGKCDTINKSITIGVATSNKDILAKEAVALLRACNVSPGELRGLGLTMTRLEEAQPVGVGSSQKRLNYFKREPVSDLLKTSVTEGASGRKPQEVVREENVPPDRPLIKAYVKPKVATLLDSFSRASMLRKEKAQPVLAQQEFEQWPDDQIGTQIEVPMDIDPDVLQFLPTQYRMAINQRIKEQEKTQIQEQQELEEEMILPQPTSQPPPGSQYDIEIWNQLGSEMRAEVIAEHEEENRRRAKEQSLSMPSLPPKSPSRDKILPWERGALDTPPQSPPKVKNLPPKKGGPSSPTKRKRGRPPTMNSGPSVSADQERILDIKGNDISSWLFAEGEVDREWFEAVDEESRQFQIAQAVKTRENKLQAARRQELKEATERERLANAIRLPIPNKQYTLSAGRPVGTIEEIRVTLSTWYESCAEIGPHGADTEELVNFLRRLVLVEHNIPKADEVVRYFMVVVRHEDGEWMSIAEEFSKAVNDALSEIGLGPIDFERG